MDNHEAVLSFMELTNLPIDEAKRYLTAAGNIIEVAIQNYYDSQADQPQTRDDQPLPEQPQFYEEEDEVRPALPREYSQLVEEESNRSIQLNRVKRQFSSSFRDLKKEMEIQENLASGTAQPKKKCLEDIYRNPIDITYNLDLETAKRLGQKQGKWIALLINDESFPSFCFNRDIFNIDASQKVKQLIKKNFILLRKNANSDESLKILHNYNLIHQSIPVFIIVDSLTGELKKNFGDTKDVTLKSVIKELKKYSTDGNNQLVYNSDTAQDSDEEVVFPSHFPSSSISHLTSQPPQKPSTATTNTATTVETDEESFASLNSDDIESENDEPKVLESDEDQVNSEAETQTSIMLKLQDQNHNFKYPSKRTVRHLINYIYRNYLVQTGIYDDKRNRFALFSRLHNKCITSLNQDLNLEESNIHPSCVLMHNTIEKE